jgi:hypothetical protein
MRESSPLYNIERLQIYQKLVSFLDTHLAM